jgi:hypothetical protein
LATAEHGLTSEVLQGLVVGVKIHVPAVDVWAKETKGGYDGIQLLLMDGVIAFRGVELLRVKPNGTVALALVLCEHGTHGKGGGVGVEP